jgi:hypothetical protein
VLIGLPAAKLQHNAGFRLCELRHRDVDVTGSISAGSSFLTLLTWSLTGYSVASLLLKRRPKCLQPPPFAHQSPNLMLYRSRGGAETPVPIANHIRQYW